MEPLGRSRSGIPPPQETPLPSAALPSGRPGAAPLKATMGDSTKEEEEESLLLAAAYVYDAQYNRNIPFETSPKTIRLYYLYNHWAMQAGTYFFIFVVLALALFEEPAVYPLPFLVNSSILHMLHLMTLIDLIIYGTLRTLNIHGVRWSRPLRPIFLINFAESRQIRRAFRSIRNTLPEITYVFLLFMFSVLMFSLMALKLFGDRNLKTLEGLPYFTNYLEVVFDMYVLVTTANSPDIMMPAYDFSWWYSLFFIIYVIINTYIFMSVFLAVVYNNYRKHLKNEIRKLAYMKRHKMIEAFNLLKVKERDEFVIQQDQWKILVKMVAPHISASHRELLLRISDEEQKGYIDKKSFVRLADLLNIEVITLKARIHPLDIWFPQVYNSTPSLVLRSIVQHRFDTSIIIAALIATVLNTALKSVTAYNSQQILDIVFILRVLRLIRIIDSVQRFRVIMNTLINIVPTMLTFGALILVVYYVFSIIGMEIFHGKIQFFAGNTTSPQAMYCGNPVLSGTTFARAKYCRNNFNDIVSSFVVLMELTIVNQWHDILFRQPFIFVAFILEAFFVEYSIEKSEVETAIEKKIQELGIGVQEDDLFNGRLIDNLETSENDLGSEEGMAVKKKPKGLMFKIASRRYRTVDALLQRMFEAEIAPEEEGPCLDEILNLSPDETYPGNPAFDRVA
ncbi:Two pore calcium channel protein 1, partial [Ophiophagus hannah]